MVTHGTVVIRNLILSPPMPHPQLSLQLFDARHELHKTTCNYALELNSLHSKTTPDFVNRIVSGVCVCVCVCVCFKGVRACLRDWGCDHLLRHFPAYELIAVSRLTKHKVCVLSRMALQIANTFLLNQCLVVATHCDTYSHNQCCFYISHISRTLGYA